MAHVRYIDRTRDYYLQQGYDKPYEWAHYDDAPFTPLAKPLSECRVTLVSSGQITLRSAEDQRTPLEKGEVGNVYSIPSDTPLDDLYSQSTSFDKYATHLDDVNAFFPITRLQELAASGRIGSVAPSLHGVHTAYSQRKTREVDAPEMLARCRAEAVDVALMVPV